MAILMSQLSIELGYMATSKGRSRNVMNIHDRRELSFAVLVTEALFQIFISSETILSESSREARRTILFEGAVPI